MKLFRKFLKNKINPFGIIIIKTVVVIMSLCIAAFFISGFDFSSLETTFYDLRSCKINEPIRIVQLSDLHLREFGEENCELLNRVSELEPDIIAVTGDLTIKNNPDYDVAISLLKNLKEIAPVYYSYGNHEMSDILFVEGCTLQQQIEATGVNVLNKSYEKINVNGSDIVIGGICGSPDEFDYFRDFMEEFCNIEDFRVLLCHRPECYESAMEGYPVDLALTGHAHGGQIRLPLLGGLYSPDQGFFPKLTDGMKILCESNVVISRGLGNSNILPRFNNDAEIVIIDIGNY